MGGAEARSRGSLAVRLGGSIATGLVAVLMTVSGVLYVVGPPPVVASFHHLGYPDYFRTLLGIAKLLGVATILTAPWATLREWAYAGIGFDLTAAILSHLISGDGFAAVPPSVVLALLVVSYVLSHRRRIASRSLPATGALAGVQDPSPGRARARG